MLVLLFFSTFYFSNSYFLFLSFCWFGAYICLSFFVLFLFFYFRYKVKSLFAIFAFSWHWLVWVCTLACVYMCRPKVNIRRLLQVSSTYLLRQSLSLYVELTYLLEWLGREFQGSVWLYLPSAWITGIYWHIQIFLLGIWDLNPGPHVFMTSSLPTWVRVISPASNVDVEHHKLHS